MRQSPLSQNDGLDKQPWHRQFWPWFLIALPATVVVASLITVYIAFKHQDPLVVDSYYRKGLAINQVLEQDRLAAQLGLTAEVRLDPESGELFVKLLGAETPPEELTLLLLHPTNQDNDRELLMSAITAGQYRTDLDQQLLHRYYIRLLPEPGREWRLAGELDFSESHQLTLKAQ